MNSTLPLEPPNADCKHALITGLQLETSLSASWDLPKLRGPGSLVEFIRIGSEVIKLWAHTEGRHSRLVAEIDRNSVTGDVRRTSAVLLELAIALDSMQESIRELGYAWIYHFNPDVPLKQQKLMNRLDHYQAENSIIETIDDWYERAHILELLTRSESFFVASQLLCYSFKVHWFCLECALRPPQCRDHEHPEPDAWNLAASIPAMENGILQATRCVEAILGKPGGRGKPQKLDRARKRWRESVTLNPDEEFHLVQTSYLQYYYELFGKRNSASHSRGRLPPDLKRAQTIAAQTFAHIVVHDRLERDAVSNDEAQRRLRCNSQLLGSVGRRVL